MSRYIALRLRKLPVVHWYYLSTPLELKARDRVITKTQHGSEVATVLRVLPDGKTADLGAEPFVKDLVRVVTPEDRDTLADLSRKETEAFQRTKDLVALHKLDMKLLKAEYLFDFSRLILYYKAENKVDFRELLKSLAGTFKTRIELRQIGVRDETKLLGGIGCCGKPVCCAQFMSDFHPVSTKMAKDQNLSMNPAKLSGMCCRLLCCIAHEHEYYASFHGKFPKIGAEIVADKEKGKVMDINFVTQKAFIVFWDRRRKLNVSLSDIKGRKDPGTGRNLWWIQEPGKPEPDLSILLQPPPQPAGTGRDKDAAEKPGKRPSRTDGKDASPRGPKPGPGREAAPTREPETNRGTASGPETDQVRESVSGRELAPAGEAVPAPVTTASAAPIEAPREELPPTSDTTSASPASSPEAPEAPDGKNKNP